MLNIHLQLATRLRISGATRILPLYALVALTDTTFILNLYQFIKIFQNHPVIMLYMTDYLDSVTEMLINLADWGELVLSTVTRGV
jgi:hypothetical protein